MAKILQLIEASQILIPTNASQISLDVRLRLECHSIRVSGAVDGVGSNPEGTDQGPTLLSDAEKKTLANIGYPLGRKPLEDVANTAKRDTLQGWYQKTSRV